MIQILPNLDLEYDRVRTPNFTYSINKTRSACTRRKTHSSSRQDFVNVALARLIGLYIVCMAKEMSKRHFQRDRINNHVLSGCCLAAMLLPSAMVMSNYESRPPVDHDSVRIPRKIHQTWKTREIPKANIPWSQSCRDMYPDWEYNLWTDDDNLELIRTHYAWFLETYQSYDDNIKRVDAARYFILHRYGGVYIDLDFACLRPMGPLINEGLPTFGIQHNNFDAKNLRKLKFDSCDQQIANAWMASPPKHPFIVKVITQLRTTAREHVVDATGPNFLTINVVEALHMYPLRVFNMPLIYNQQWNASQPCTSISDCRTEEPTAYFATFWTHTWKST